MSEPARLPVGPAAVPGLPDVLADRSLLDHLKMDALVDIRRQIRHLEVDIEATITSRTAQDNAHDDTGAVVGLKEAAKRLNTSADSLYRKRKRLRLGYIDPLDRRLKFTEQEITDYIRRQRRT